MALTIGIKNGLKKGFTKEELQGDIHRRNGFALDPIGFQRERQLQGNHVDETNAGFWSFSYHSQKDDTSSTGTANNRTTSLLPHHKTQTLFCSGVTLTLPQLVR